MHGPKATLICPVGCSPGSSPATTASPPPVLPPTRRRSGATVTPSKRIAPTSQPHESTTSEHSTSSPSCSAVMRGCHRSPPERICPTASAALTPASLHSPVDFRSATVTFIGRRSRFEGAFRIKKCRSNGLVNGYDSRLSIHDYSKAVIQLYCHP